ncbi:hypothetical protein NUW54_g12316 [Trametes sanguinea]|uniref:Uncharacterized protein n=1 Tax=Trametes sanguinea TaxID=158606 RepID=A0ACC1N000_9APHY|nr:hypothetical protein NUW54_g12316 [Trametes sanguinea]
MSRRSYLTRITNGYEAFYQNVRFLPRVLGEFNPIEEIFTVGGVIAVSPNELNELDPAQDYSKECHLVRGYELLSRYFNVLEQHDEQLRSNPDAAKKLFDYLSAVMRRARSDDLSRLRNRVVEYAKPGLEYDNLKVKTNRGFKHAITGRLLCPITKLTEFDQDPAAFCRRVRMGDIKIFSLDWPLFLYDEQQYKPGKVKPGLLRSPYLVKCYKVVYTGPQSADDDLMEDASSRGKPSLSQKYHIGGVTPETITYVCALVRTLLSSQKSWSHQDGHWKGPDFVRSLLRLFERHTDWADDTLVWWQSQVYSESGDLEVDPDECAANMFDAEEDAEEGAQLPSDNEEPGYRGADDGDNAHASDGVSYQDHDDD